MNNDINNVKQKISAPGYTDSYNTTPILYI